MTNTERFRKQVNRTMRNLDGTIDELDRNIKEIEKERREIKTITASECRIKKGILSVLLGH